jgi:hypothetical protein
MTPNSNNKTIPGLNGGMPSSIGSVHEREDTVDDFRGLVNDIGSFKQVRAFLKKISKLLKKLKEKLKNQIFDLLLRHF